MSKRVKTKDGFNVRSLFTLRHFPLLRREKGRVSPRPHSCLGTWVAWRSSEAVACLPVMAMLSWGCFRETVPVIGPTPGSQAFSAHRAGVVWAWVSPSSACSVSSTVGIAAPGGLVVTMAAALTPFPQHSSTQTHGSRGLTSVQTDPPTHPVFTRPRAISHTATACPTSGRWLLKRDVPLLDSVDVFYTADGPTF